MAPTMIDYAILCRAIDDWKAGRQPSAVTPAAPQRIATRPAEDEEAVVEYSAMYDTSVAAPEGEAPDSTVLYAMPEDGEVEADADVESDTDAYADAEAEVDVDDPDADPDADHR